jgi:tetratricopeptide (TPR) repeat protein
MCLILVALFSVSQSAAWAHSAQQPLLARRPAFKPIEPQTDYSVVPDPAEVFDHAVKEYVAGHMLEAKKLFEDVINIDPKNADAQFNLGAILEWKNDLPNALKHYQAALSLKPDDREIREAVQAVEYKIKNRTALETQARQQKQEHDLELHSVMAKEAFASQNYAEAISHLSVLAKSMPDDAKIQFALGQSLRALKFYEYAAYRLKLAIYLDPDNELYRKTLADLDKELIEVQGEAFKETADMALSKITPLTFIDLADTGVYPHALQ